MPKLKEVKVTENTMSWNDTNCFESGRKIVTYIPIREFKQFLEKGKQVKKITVEFTD